MKWWPKKKKTRDPENARRRKAQREAKTSTPGKQDLDLYWDPKMADILETWGEAHVWREVRLLFWQSEGKVLDIACGTGKTMEILEQFGALEVHGCDISDLLIQRAADRGIPADRIKVADATNLDCYETGQFRHSYSIGSLEHFTESGIDDFVRESHRVTTGFSAHMIPISRSGEDEGWMKTVQSFFNNSESWWRTKFEKYYDTVVFAPSGWEDKISIGVWILCHKAGE